MILRSASKDVALLMKQFPAVGVVGPRQSGKTTIARDYLKKVKQQAIYLDLESPSDVRKLNDPELYLSALEDKVVIIDEVQRMPELFAVLRYLIDRRRRPGRFLLLGSSSPEMIKNASESLAGRIYYYEVCPFGLRELKSPSSEVRKHWFRGGFPSAFLAKNDKAWNLWTAAFYRTYIERDMNTLFGRIFSNDTLRRLWKMAAHHHGQVLNLQSFSKGLDVSPTTVSTYLDFLQGAFLMRKLSAYHFNSGKRLVKSPKLYIRDSGLLHHLLDIHSSDILHGHLAVGYSWEGYAIEQIIQVLPPGIVPYFYRTHEGSELDLVLVKGVKPTIGIEIKYGFSPLVSKGMWNSIADLKTKSNFIITPGKQPTYPIAKGILCCNLEHFLRKELPALLK